MSIKVNVAGQRRLELAAFFSSFFVVVVVVVVVVDVFLSPWPSVSSPW
jgi:hypothetical protein